MPFIHNEDSSDDSSDDLVFVGSQGLTRIRKDKSKKNEEHHRRPSQNFSSSQTRPKDEGSKGHNLKKTLENLEELTSSLCTDSEDDFELSAEAKNLSSLSSQKPSLKGKKRNEMSQNKCRTVDDSGGSSSTKHHRTERFIHQNTSKQNKSTKAAKHKEMSAFSSSKQPSHVSQTQREHTSSSDSSDLEETPYSKNQDRGRPSTSNYSTSRKLFSRESSNTPTASHSSLKRVDKEGTGKKCKLKEKKKSSGFSSWISTHKSNKTVRSVTDEVDSENVINESDSESDTESVLKSQGMAVPSVQDHNRKKKHDKSKVQQVKSQALLKGHVGQEPSKKSQMTISNPLAKSSGSALCDPVITARTEKGGVENIILESESDSDSESIFQSQAKCCPVSNYQNKWSDQRKCSEQDKSLGINCLRGQPTREFNCLSEKIMHSNLKIHNAQENVILKQNSPPQPSKPQGMGKLSLLSGSTRKLKNQSVNSSHVEEKEISRDFQPSSSTRKNPYSRDSEILLKLKEKKSLISSLLKNALKESPKSLPVEDDTVIFLDDEGAPDKEQAKETLIILDSGNTDDELSEEGTQVIASNKQAHSEDSDDTVLLSEMDTVQKEPTKIEDFDSHSSSVDKKAQKSLSKAWSLDSESTIEYKIPTLSDNNDNTVEIVPSSSSPMQECVSPKQIVCVPTSPNCSSSETCSEIIPFQDKTASIERETGNITRDLSSSQESLFQRTPSMPELTVCPTTLSYNSSREGESGSSSQSMPVLTPQKETSLVQKDNEELTPERSFVMPQLTPIKDRSVEEKNSSLDTLEKLEKAHIKVMVTSTPIVQVKTPEKVVNPMEVKATMDDQKTTGSIDSAGSCCLQNNNESPLFSQDISSDTQQIKADITSILKNLDSSEQLFKCDNKELSETHDCHKETDTDTLEIDPPDNAEIRESRSDDEDKSKSSFYEAEDPLVCVYESDDEELFNTQAVFRTSFETNESSAVEETSEEDYRMTQENSLWWDSDDSEIDYQLADSVPSPSSASKECATSGPKSDGDSGGQNQTMDDEQTLKATVSSAPRYTLQTRYFDENFIAAYEKAAQGSAPGSTSDGNFQNTSSSSLKQNTGCISTKVLGSCSPSNRAGTDTVHVSASDAISPSDRDTQIDTESDNDNNDNPDPYLVPTQVVMNIEEDKDDNSDFNDDDYLAHSQIDYLFISSDDDDDDNCNEIAVSDANHHKAIDSEDKEYHVTFDNPNSKSDNNMAITVKVEIQTEKFDCQSLSSQYLAQTLQTDDNVLETEEDPFSLSTQVEDDHASPSHSPNFYGQFEYRSEKGRKEKTNSRYMSITSGEQISGLTDEIDVYDVETQIDIGEDELSPDRISGEHIDPYEVDTQIVCADEPEREKGEKKDGEMNKKCDETRQSSQKQPEEAQKLDTFDLSTQRAVPENMHISTEDGVSENNIVEYMSSTQVDEPIKKPCRVAFLFKQSSKDKLRLMTEGIFDKIKKDTHLSLGNEEKEEEMKGISEKQGDPKRGGNNSPGNDALDELFSMQTMAEDNFSDDMIEDPEGQDDKNSSPTQLQGNNDILGKSERNGKSLQSDVSSETIYKSADLAPGISVKKSREMETDMHRKGSHVKEINENCINSTERAGNIGGIDEDLEATLEYDLENFYDGIEEPERNDKATVRDKQSSFHATTHATIRCSSKAPGMPSDSPDMRSKRKCEPPSGPSDPNSKKLKLSTSKNVKEGLDNDEETNDRVKKPGKLETHRNPGRSAILIHLPAHKGNQSKEKDKKWLSSSSSSSTPSKSAQQQKFQRKPVEKQSRKSHVTPKKRQQENVTSLNEQIKKAKILNQQRLQNGAVSGASGNSHWRKFRQADVCELKELEDVEMPSTQEMMKSGLPILNAHTPIDKKKLEQGVPNLPYLRPANTPPDKTHSKNTPCPQSETDDPEKSGHGSSKQSTSSSNKGNRVDERDHNRGDEVQFSKNSQKLTVRNLNPEKKDNEKLSQNLNSCKKVEEKSSHVKDRTSSSIDHSLSNQRNDKSTVRKVVTGKGKNWDGEKLPKNKEDTNEKHDDDEDDMSTVKGVASSSENQSSAKGNSTLSPQSTGQSSNAEFKKPVSILRDRNSRSTLKHGRAPSKVKIDDSRNNIFYVPARPAPCAPHSLSTFSPQPQTQLQTYIPDCPAKCLTPFCTEAEFIYRIITWNPGWLPEQDKQEKPPPILGDHHTFSQLRTSYDDIETYQKTSFELLLLEIWAMIHTDWKKHSQGETLEGLICSIPQHSTEEEQKLGILSFELKVILNQAKKHLVPNSGDLIILYMQGSFKADPKTKQQYKQFAYVKDAMEIFNHGRNCELFKTMKENFPGVMDSRSRIFNVKICVKYKTFVPSADFLKIERVSSLTPSRRQFQALVNLPKNPVSKALINPCANDPVFFIPYHKADLALKTLNSEQALAVTKISKAILEQPGEPRICLLQGPPGTGKSHTILALIHQILFKSGFKARICLAAPSNAAVDEIARRIIMFSQKKCSSQNLREINVLRVGLLDRVSDAVKPHHLENKFMEKIRQHHLNMAPSLKEELIMVEKKIQNLKASSHNAFISDAQKVSNNAELRRLQQDLKKLEAEVGNKSWNNSERRRLESIIVEESHVICSTLSSFGSGIIQPLLRYHYGSKMKRQPFNCLIVDEATQAIEMETLIPLQYMMSKVVLVGDQQQLPPTVNSKDARDYRFDRSLFERLHSKFSASPEINPIMTLKKQYRMHPEILVLPNSYFYHSQLYTEESVIAGRQSALSPYLVFDLQDGQETSDKFGSFSNKLEASFVSKLCQHVIKRLNIKLQNFSNRIGIICPYADQKQKIQECLRQSGLGAIEVNTVDGFQGQEKDVIIMSCVRAQENPQTIGFTGDGKRINVALTRAKLALYIVGHFKTLSISELWRLLHKDAKSRKLLVSVSNWDSSSRKPFQAIDYKQITSTNKLK